MLSIELIPAVCADQLELFTGAQLVAGVDVEGVGSHVYVVELCDGCLTRCQSEVDADIRDALATQCRDDAGADGRLCIDPDC